MSSFISGGGRSYGFDNIELVKSASTSSRTSNNSSSPSSAISESINSPRAALSTRKPRTQRKRPNQTYNEAAALLSTVYPNIFSSKNLSKHTKLLTSFPEEFSQFLPLSPAAFSNVEFLLHPVSHKPNLSIQLKPAPSSNSAETPCQSSPTSDTYFQLNSDEDFDAESILDEEIEEGIDSIMGNLSVHNNSDVSHSSPSSCWNPIAGLEKFEFGFGNSNGGVSALRHAADDVDWWQFPTVDILAISPKLNKVTCEKKKKKKKKKKKMKMKMKMERIEELKIPQSSLDNTNSNSNSNPESGIGLKLSYQKVLDAWSDRGSPFSEDILGADSSETDAIARLAQIDLFSENGGLREASVLRYREKRRSRLFSKKIRYQVRKVNADRRPRMKGRFVRRPASTLRDEKK